MKKSAKLEWYAFNHDSNTDNFYQLNVLGEEFSKEIVKRIKQKSSYGKIQDYASLREQVRIMLMSKFWSRAEYEYLVTGLFTKDEDKVFKKDVWYQLEPNLDRICEYIIRELDLDETFGPSFRKKKTDTEE